MAAWSAARTCSPRSCTRGSSWRSSASSGCCGATHSPSLQIRASASSAACTGTAYMAFQMMFAVITPALITGAFAERKRFKAFVRFTLLWATFVYDPIAHWVWGTGGWLHALGTLDFAGGTVVHISSGASALVAAIV